MLLAEGFMGWAHAMAHVFIARWPPYMVVYVLINVEVTMQHNCLQQMKPWTVRKAYCMSVVPVSTTGTHTQQDGSSCCQGTK